MEQLAPAAHTQLASAGSHAHCAPGQLCTPPPQCVEVAASSANSTLSDIDLSLWSGFIGVNEDTVFEVMPLAQGQILSDRTFSLSLACHTGTGDAGFVCGANNAASTTVQQSDLNVDAHWGQAAEGLAGSTDTLSRDASRARSATTVRAATVEHIRSNIEALFVIVKQPCRAPTGTAKTLAVQRTARSIAIRWCELCRSATRVGYAVSRRAATHIAAASLGAHTNTTAASALVVAVKRVRTLGAARRGATNRSARTQRTELTNRTTHATRAAIEPVVGQVYAGSAAVNRAKLTTASAVDARLPGATHRSACTAIVVVREWIDTFVTVAHGVAADSQRRSTANGAPARDTTLTPRASIAACTTVQRVALCVGAMLCAYLFTRLTNAGSSNTVLALFTAIVARPTVRGATCKHSAFAPAHILPLSASAAAVDASDAYGTSVATTSAMIAVREQSYASARALSEPCRTARINGLIGDVGARINRCICAVR